MKHATKSKNVITMSTDIHVTVIRLRKNTSRAPQVLWREGDDLKEKAE